MRMRGGPGWTSIAAISTVFGLMCAYAQALTLVENGKPRSILLYFSLAENTG